MQDLATSENLVIVAVIHFCREEAPQLQEERS
jgi:hypothetical protein